HQRSGISMRRVLAAVALITLVASCDAPTTEEALAAVTLDRAAKAFIRVDQVGYASSETKRAYLLGQHSLAGATFRLKDSGGRVLLTGKVGASAGAWNDRYGAVHPIDFTAIGVPGTYTLEAAGAVSPKFRVGFGWDLFGPLAADAIDFFNVQRDGA